MAAAKESNGSAMGYKLGDFGLATLKSGHWRVQEGDSRYVCVGSQQPYRHCY